MELFIVFALAMFFGIFQEQLLFVEHPILWNRGVLFWEGMAKDSDSGKHTFGNSLLVFSQCSTIGNRNVSPASLGKFFLPWELNSHGNFSTVCVFLHWSEWAVSSSLSVSTVVLDTSTYYLELEEMNIQIGQIIYPRSCYYFIFCLCEHKSCSTEDLPNVLPEATQSLSVGNASSSLEQSRSDLEAVAPMCKFSEKWWEMFDLTKELWEEGVLGGVCWFFNSNFWAQSFVWLIGL